MMRRNYKQGGLRMQIAYCKLQNANRVESGQWAVDSGQEKRVQGSGFRVQNTRVGTQEVGEWGQRINDHAKPQAVSSGIISQPSFLNAQDWAINCPALTSLIPQNWAINCPALSVIILLIIVNLFFPFSAPVQAANVQPPEIVGVRVGIGERCKVGLWTPVEVTLLGGGESLTGTVTVTVPDGDGIPSRVLTPPSKPCQVLPGRQTTALLYARIGQVTSELNVEYVVGGRVAARKIMESSFKADGDHFMYPLEAQMLVVSVGPSAVGLEDISRLKEMDNEHRLAVARIDDIGQLPTTWYGYEGVSAVVMSTSQPEIYRKLMPEGARLDALEQWIRMGGRLVLCVGSQADEVLAQDSALKRFSPGRLEKIFPLTQTGALETYSGGSAAVPQGPDGKLSIQAAKLSDIQGIVEAREADLPLVIRTPHGFGQIVFVAADLDQGPLSKWNDRPLLVAKLLDLPAGRSQDQTDNAALMHNGYTDLSGQLRSALDEFTGVRTIPFSLVAVLIIVYILLIGPGDYFFLRKVVRRMEWTWLSFPIIVLP